MKSKSRQTAICRAAVEDSTDAELLIVLAPETATSVTDAGLVPKATGMLPSEYQQIETYSRPQMFAPSLFQRWRFRRSYFSAVGSSVFFLEISLAL